ncbi:MAG: DUF4374 domain-containing protein, partial [Hymenobacter sp.]
YYVTTNNKFFSMLYGQGNPGAVTAYNVQGGKLTKLTNFQTETVQSFAPVDKDLLLFKISRGLTSPTSLWYKVSTDNLLITANGSTKPSAVTRIKSGTTVFDQSYYLDFESISGGLNITNWLYLGSNLYLVNATSKADKGAYAVGKNVGILDVAAKTYKAVTGLPAAADIKSLTTNNYTPKDSKTGYIGVNLNDGTGYIYKVDASTQTASKGLAVEGGVITAVQYLAE